MRTEPCLVTSLWPAEPGEVRDVTVCQVLYHAAETVPGRIALVDCVEDPARRRQWAYAEFIQEAERVAYALLAQLQSGLPALRAVVSLNEWDAFLARGGDATPLPEVKPHDINAMPMYHIGGGAVTSFGAWAKRGTFVILPGFSPATILQAFETYRGTHTLVVPTMLIAMLDHPDLTTRDLSSLHTILSGASSVPASLVTKTIAALNCQFSILFGQTEAHGVVSQTRVTDSPGDQASTVGQPLPQLEIAGMDTGDPVPLDEQGEICVRGYQTMRGYYEMPRETAATIDPDGWLHMGDIGSMDARGFLKVTGRDRPAIADLTEFLRTQLAPHKCPVYWSFTDALPMTPSGKIQKFVLRDQAAQGALLFDQARPTAPASS